MAYLGFGLGPAGIILLALR